jgi:hypothetical protein
MSTFAVASDDEVVPRVVGVNDAEQRMSRPAEAHDQMSFSGGMVPVEAHAAAHPGYMEAPIMLRDQRPLSPLAPPGYDRPKGPDNNNFIPGPHAPVPKPGICGTADDPRANTSCMPFPEPGVGSQIKTGVGKAWSILQHFIGTDDHDVAPSPAVGAPRA